MSIGTAELIAGCVAVGTLGGFLLRGAVKIGRKEGGFDALERSHAGLKGEFIRHKDNRDIHLDPKRDNEAWDQFATEMRGCFSGVNARLDTIDQRCERRGEVCADHFEGMATKIAAAAARTKRGD